MILERQAEMRRLRIERDNAMQCVTEQSALINHLKMIEKQSLLVRFSSFTPETVSQDASKNQMLYKKSVVKTALLLILHKNTTMTLQRCF